MLVVETLTDLDRILERRTRDRSRVVLELPSMERTERDVWERRINRHYRACGCETGAVALAIAAASIAVLAATNQEQALERPAYWAGLAVILLCTALATGKAVGLWISRLQLKSTIQELRITAVANLTEPTN